MSKCGEKNGNAKGDGVLPISISIDILLQEDEFDCLAYVSSDESIYRIRFFYFRGPKHEMGSK